MARPALVCPFCEKFHEEIFNKLKTCPACGRDLLARIEARSRMAIQRVDGLDTSEVDSQYSSEEVVRIDAPVVHDAHAVLNYAGGLLRLLEAVFDFADHMGFERTAVLGFHTGSEPLDWLISRRAGLAFEGRFRHSRGLAHKGGGADPDGELVARLDNWARDGVTALVVVDEVVSGTQLRTAFLRVRDWFVRAGLENFSLHLIGVREARPGQLAEGEFIATRVLMGDAGSLPPGLAVTGRIVDVMELLAKDAKGDVLGSVRKERDGSYRPNRVWPGGYTVRCPHHLTVGGGASLNVIWSAGSIDQTFGVSVYAVCGFGYVNEGQWPETIKAYGCAECKALLAEARRRADILAHRHPSPERVFGRVVGPEPPEVGRPIAAMLRDHRGKPIIAFDEDDED